MSEWRFRLPALMLLPTAALLSWEAHNSDIIASMGKAWDTGVPVWPYQTPEILLAILNAPAYLLAAPVWLSFGLRTAEERAPVLMSAILVLWFCVGKAIDDGLIPPRSVHRRRILMGLSALLAIVFVWIAATDAMDGIEWWSAYGRMSLPALLIFARTVASLAWCIVAISVLVRVIVRQSACVETGKNREVHNDRGG